MRVLVCGGRKFDDLPFLDKSLDQLHADLRITMIIHGGANGADTMAHFWAGVNGVPIEVYHANWKRDGRAAGPIRNQKMLDHGKPDAVAAFPGGRGTADMIRRAIKASIPIYTYQRIGGTMCPEPKK